MNPEEQMTDTDTMVNVPSIEIAQPRERPAVTTHRETVFNIQNCSVSYGKTPAVHDISLEIYRNMVTAIIGPSGCGKSTFIRTLNRMNDLVPTAKVTGDVLYHGVDLYGSKVDPVQVRRRIGMVFQKQNTFYKSIYDHDV